MFSSIRNYEYLQAYFKLVNKYKNELHSILCTYYKFSVEHSVYDKDVLRYGAYERVGKLSGYKWYKINLLPVAFITETHPVEQATEYGVVKKTETFAVFKDYSFMPTNLDFITFNIETQTNNVYQITNIEESYIGKNETPTFYKVTLKEQFIGTEDLNKQLIGEYTYNEILDKLMYPKESANITRLYMIQELYQQKLQNNTELSSGLPSYLEK